jgi:hypothetical protein
MVEWSMHRIGGLYVSPMPMRASSLTRGRVAVCIARGRYRGLASRGDARFRRRSLVAPSAWHRNLFAFATISTKAARSTNESSNEFLVTMHPEIRSSAVGCSKSFVGLDGAITASMLLSNILDKRLGLRCQ